jgi:type VI secretion system protein ImpF
MSFVEQQRPLSFWDQLVDDAPEGRSGDPFAQRRSVDFSRLSLLIDLEKLLNTRRRNVPGDAGRHPALEHSILTYGLEDFSGSDMSSPAELERLRAEVEASIKRFETRLKQVNVQLLPPREEWDHCVRFAIHAQIADGLESVYAYADVTKGTGEFRLVEGGP